MDALTIEMRNFANIYNSSAQRLEDYANRRVPAQLDRQLAHYRDHCDLRKRLTILMRSHRIAHTI